MKSFRILLALFMIVHHVSSNVVVDIDIAQNVNYGCGNSGSKHCGSEDSGSKENESEDSAENGPGSEDSGSKDNESEDSAENGPGPGNIWVVLVAGSEGWENYRHQSDICHAYQILSSYGIPDDHIIVMMYDDIAFNIKNQMPGQIINSPTGPNVYSGVPKDYTGSDVTVDNFFKVLKGDAEALKGVGSGKFVNSGPNDRIFINFVDHGGVGLFCFPDGYMMANDFANVVLNMHANDQFKEMMVYMESCESGSMFQHLFPNDTGFYALSASSPTEPSYAVYWSDLLYTYLGDLFSVNWMDDVEANDPTEETLKENFDITRQLTNLSEVMQWGQISIEDEFVSAFMGSGSLKKSSLVKRHSDEERKTSSVISWDVPLIILQNRVKAAKDMEEEAYWTMEIVAFNKSRSVVHDTIKGIAMAVAGNESLFEELMEQKQDKITNWDCYGDAVDAFHTNCFNLGQSTYALTVVSTLLNLCEAGYNTNIIISAINNTCTFPTMYNVD